MSHTTQSPPKETSHVDKVSNEEIYLIKWVLLFGYVIARSLQALPRLDKVKTLLAMPVKKIPRNYQQSIAKISILLPSTIDNTPHGEFLFVTCITMISNGT